MASEPRLIPGPCIDCDETKYGCVCAFLADSDLVCPCHRDSKTAPIPKQPEGLRPNVPPRMM